MRNLQRLGMGIAVASLSFALGSVSASAYTWAPSGSPVKVNSDGVFRGGGYGSANYVNYSTGRLVSYLSDARVDSMRTFVDLYGTRGPQGGIGTQSGRRSDGGTAYAKMADKDWYSAYPYGVAQYTYYVKVCMDRSWASDPCTLAPTSPHAGL